MRIIAFGLLTASGGLQASPANPPFLSSSIISLFVCIDTTSPIHESAISSKSAFSSLEIKLTSFCAKSGARIYKWSPVRPAEKSHETAITASGSFPSSLSLSETSTIGASPENCTPVIPLSFSTSGSLRASENFFNASASILTAGPPATCPDGFKPSMATPESRASISSCDIAPSLIMHHLLLR